MHELDDAGIEGGFDAVLSAPLDNTAVYDVDLGLRALLEVLEHRSLGRPGVAHSYFEGFVGPLAVFGAACDEGIRGDSEDLVHSDPLGRPDVVAFAPDGERCLSPCRVGDDLAVEQARDGAEARECAVDEQLGPYLAADVLRDTHVGHRLEHFGEEAGPFLRAALGFPDHERRPRGLRQMAGSKVRSPPLHRPDDEVLASDDRGYTILHEPVAQRDERSCQAALHERMKSGFEVGRFEGDEGEIEGAFEVRGIGVGIEAHAALLAQFVEQEARILHPLDVLCVGVQDAYASHPALHLRCRYAADGSGPDYEDTGFYHEVSFPTSTGGRSSSSAPSAA